MTRSPNNFCAPTLTLCHHGGIARTLAMLTYLLAACATGSLAPAAADPELYVFPPESVQNGERFHEDWSRMAESEAHTRPWHGLKWIELDDEIVLSLGGDLKWRAEYVDAPYFAVNREEEDDYVVQRLMLHADLRLGQNVRFFGQLGLHDGIGRQTEFPFDDNGLDLQQAFVDFSSGTQTSHHALRLGRQEIILTPRFTTPRGAVNIRAAFDGARGWIKRGPLYAEAWATRPVINDKGAFNDERDEDHTFSGIRAFYAFGREDAWRLSGMVVSDVREENNLGLLSGRDDRTSWSVRLEGRARGFDLDIEHYQQTGDIAGLEIEAFGGGGDVGYTWENVPWQPRLGARWTYGSGDDDPADNQSGTFFGPYPRAPCCADPLWIGPSNMASYAPVLQFRPIEKLSLELKADFISRLKATDGIYAVPAIVYPASVGLAGDDFISFAPGASLAWAVTEEVTMRAYYVNQTAEGVLADIGGQDSSFSVLSLYLRF